MRLGRGGEFWSLVEICSGEFLGAVCGTKKRPDGDIGPYEGRRWGKMDFRVIVPRESILLEDGL